jgi:hypothetical protein
MKKKSKSAYSFHTLLAVLASLFLMNCASMTVGTQTWDKTFAKELFTVCPTCIDIIAIAC